MQPDTHITPRVKPNPVYVNPHEPFYHQPSQYEQGKPPGVHYDSIASAAPEAVQKSSQDSLDDSLKELSLLLENVKNNPAACLEADIHILRAIFNAVDGLQKSHETTRSGTIDEIFKDKQVSRVLKKETLDAEEDRNKSSWWSWFFGFATKIFQGLALGATGVIIFAGGPAAIPAAVTYLQGLLAASQAATSSVGQYYQYKSGEHEKKRLQLNFEREKNQKKLNSKIRSIGQIQERIAALQKQRKAALEAYHEQAHMR